MDSQQQLYLTTFNQHGGYLEPSDDEGKRVCKELCAMKFLRPQPVLHTKSLEGRNAKITLAYAITAKGRKAAAKIREASHA